ncbi:dihydrodipicolinate reductase [Tateyamaria omphalii]|uniref:Dihydrodipicolinate reductase n=1 Tax=Tateyamaria omphalii TaxID=299262 RepID=A0A1P8MZ61_9RHOB|nr:dihydrodipicolinate reductase [Tateyamaria omphalii]APX13366.1 dihydrodipicolinate reductase [Tateyamaria omphalii]
MRLICLVAAAALSATSAMADLVKVDNQNRFVQLVNGKTLTRPFVKLNVTPDGRIEGRGARWDVEGTWSWQNGYFCRDLFWGGDPLGYNCQEVQATADGRIKFTSDRGAGDSAMFRLR